MKKVIYKGILISSIILAVNAYADNTSNANKDRHFTHHHDTNTRLNEKEAMKSHLCDHGMNQKEADKHAKDHNGSHIKAHSCDHNNDLYRAEAHMIHH